MKTQAEKAAAFQALHSRPQAFIIPNPWDIGTARLLEHFGFEALATTSAGYAFSAGKADNTADRFSVMQHVASLATASDLPVSADWGNGFGDDPRMAAEAIQLAAQAGAVGGSIEDATGHGDHAIYEQAHAVERVKAAVEAARTLPFPFTLTARAENYLNGKPDLNDTIKRLQLYQSAGADVLYAPGIVKRDEIAALLCSVDRPVNVLTAIPGITLNLQELSALGVRRVSVGSALSRLAMTSFLRAAQEMREHGTFTFAENILSFREINKLFQI
jgi:2-methylisocitrate lyase-like PEP mutase family enzyme